MQNYHQIPLDELCSMLIANTRSFADWFPKNDISVDTLEHSSIRRILDGMRANPGVSRKDDTDIDILSAILRRELERETLGWVTVFDGRNDPELGAIGDVREVRDLSDRGRMIEDCVRSLQQLAHMRSICRARLDAEKLVMGR